MEDTRVVALTPELIARLTERGFGWSRLVGGIMSLTWPERLTQGLPLPQNFWNFEPRDGTPTITIEGAGTPKVFCRSPLRSADGQKFHDKLAANLLELTAAAA